MSSRNIAIDENSFKSSLSEKFIELIDSERGLQSILAKSIGKRPSFIGEVKRGKPVNALHLKAVDLVFGPAKVIELLSMDINQFDPKKFFDLLPHSVLVKSFQQKDLARELSLNAIKLEKALPEALKEINDYIKFKLQNLETSASGETPSDDDARKNDANGQ